MLPWQPSIYRSLLFLSRHFIGFELHAPKHAHCNSLWLFRLHILDNFLDNFLRCGCRNNDRSRFDLAQLIELASDPVHGLCQSSNLVVGALYSAGMNDGTTDK